MVGTVPEVRVRVANEAEVANEGDYVLALMGSTNGTNTFHFRKAVLDGELCFLAFTAPAFQEITAGPASAR